MTDPQTILKASERLKEAAKTKTTCPPIRELIGETDLKSAYSIQSTIRKSRLASGRRLIGCKIGLTSKAVQAQLGVDQPDYGMLFDDMEVLNGDSLAFDQLMQPKIEAEIAFVLGKDLNTPYLGTVEVINSIDYALAALEIVGSRIEGWNIKITDTIADNASASHFVLGHQPTRLENLDLLGCQMEMTKNNKIVSQGNGADCLGSPINATIWLARTMAKLGQPLKAGDIILTGALGPMSSVAAGDHFKAKISGLGSVSINFT